MATTNTVPFDQMPGLVWFDGKLVSNPDAMIHVLTHGLHYASTVYEGERVYNGRIFKQREHSERAAAGSRALGAPLHAGAELLCRRGRSGL